MADLSVLTHSCNTAVGSSLSALAVLWHSLKDVEHQIKLVPGEKCRFCLLVCNAYHKQERMLISGHRKVTTLACVEVNKMQFVWPRYEDLAESVEEYVLDMLRDQLNRRQPMDNVSRNLLRLLTATCGYKEVRQMAVQRLEMWLQNPKVRIEAVEAELFWTWSGIQPGGLHTICQLRF